MTSIKVSVNGAALGREPKVASATATSTGSTLVNGPARVLGVQFRAGSTKGSVVLKDGGATGTTKLTLYTPANAAFADYVPIPEGLEFLTDVYVELDQADGVTILYQ